MWSRCKPALLVVHLLALLLVATEVVAQSPSQEFPEIPGNEENQGVISSVPGCWRPGEAGMTITCTKGKGGKTCDKTACLADPFDDVSCVGNKKCRCRGVYDKGDGQVVCAQPDQHVCYLINDPKLKPYEGPGVDVPVSCRFPMTAFESVSTDGSGQPIVCIVEAAAWGVKGRGKGRVGKHYGGGMDISITVVHAGVRNFHWTRISGEARYGVYRFSEQVSTHKESMVYGPARPTVIPGIGFISTIYDYVNNIAEVRADFCGVRMGFRPAEFKADKSQQGQLSPGVYVKVDKLYNPWFKSGLCLTPNTTVDDLVQATQDETNKQVSRETAVMAMALKNSIAQDFPDAPPILPALAKTAQECDMSSLVYAIEKCMFVTKHPKFLRCYGRRADDANDYEDDDDISNVPGGEGGHGGSASGGGGSASGGSASGGGGSDPDIIRHRQRRDEEFIIPEDDGPEDEEDKQLEMRRINKSLRLMHRCIQSFCVGSSTLCELAKANVRATHCHTHIPTQALSIMSFDCNKLDLQPHIHPH